MSLGLAFNPITDLPKTKMYQEMRGSIWSGPMWILAFP